MSTFKFGLLLFLTSLALGSKCPRDDISKLVVCYYEGTTSLADFNLCNCTHVVFTNAVTRSELNGINITEDAAENLRNVKERKENLQAIFTLQMKGDVVSRALKSDNRSEALVDAVHGFLRETQFDGVEINFGLGAEDGVSKESFTAFIKDLSKTLSSQHPRVKREGYDVFEKLDDITTAAYTTQTPKNSTSKTQSIKQSKRKDSTRKIREEAREDPDDKDYLTLEEAINTEFSERPNTLDDLEEEPPRQKKFLLFVRLSLRPEIIAKKYDLKALSRYSDILVVPTHDITSTSEENLTYHPSRLMGLSDILNTDSILDLLTGLGGLKSKMVISVPATVLRFELKDESKNTPRAPSKSKPETIDQSQLCALFSKSNWTVERDEDLTAPYAFSGKTWLAFEDEISLSIKGKYILLRELAGGAIYPIDADASDGSCANRTGFGGYLTGVLHRNFERMERKPRALVLESLQEEIHDTAYASIEAGVKLSEYRIVRVVDHTGAVHVIRKNTKTQFECSRQGYFSHPLGCNKFYRCVKFDQYSDEFTVFEYDCPAGLAFDERWEVCVWPGSLPHGAPCTGSSEIAPVPRSHYRCPNQEGYYPDPENCRWFFACLDHARDGITPLTAYEFRCPFGLVFSAEKLACDWPWLVGSCGAGGAGYLGVATGGVHSVSFINGGNLEASLGQYGDTGEEDSFANFGSKFGSVLKGRKGSYEGAQSAGFGYIASAYNGNDNRASFGSFPEYEISGGRVFNKGGVILNENIATVSDGGGAAGVKVVAGAGGSARGFGAGAAGLNVVGGAGGSARGFGTGAGYFSEVHSVGLQSGGDVGLTQPQEILRTSSLNVGGHAVNEVRQENPISTPKPFSVSIPSVQVNSEFSGHSTAGATTPQSVLLTATPPTDVFHHQQQFSTAQGFTATQPTVGVSLLTPSTPVGTFGGALSGSTHIKAPVSTTVRPETQRFEPSGFKQNNLLLLNSGAASTGPAVGVHSFGFESAGGVSTPASVSLPVVTSAGRAFEFSSGSRATGFYQPTETPLAGFSQQNHVIAHQSSVGVGKSTVSVSTPAVQTHSVGGADSGLLSGNAAVGVSYGGVVSTVTPAVYTSQVKTGGGFSSQHSIDEKVSNELYLNTPRPFAVASVTPKTELFSKTIGQANVVSGKIPAVTPKTDFRFSQAGHSTFGGAAGKTPLLYSFPVVTPQPGLKLDGGVGGVSSVGGSFSGVTAGTGFVEAGKQFSGASYGAPVTSQQGTVVQTGKTSYSVPVLGSEVTGEVSHGFVQSTVSPPVQQSGQGYSFGYSGHFGSIGSTPSPAILETAAPKIQHTEVTIEQQPVVSVGTVSSVTGFSTPRPFQPAVSHVSFKSNLNEQVSVSTPAPAVSISSPASVTFEPPPHSLNVFVKSPKTIQQQETLINVPDVSFDEKSSNLQQEFKTFTPVAAVTSAPSSKFFGVKSDVYAKGRSYLPPVTPKVEVFGSTAQQIPQVPTKLLQFENTAQERNPVVHSFGFFGSKSEKPTAFTTVAPQFEGPAVSTLKPFTPQEKLVGLEITKSVEINPSEFFQSSGGFTSGDSIEIRQQPLHLISQKTFPAKQVIQPFYKQQETEVQGNQQGFAFQQEVKVETPKTEFIEQKQYLPPVVSSKPQLSAVSYSTPKTVSIQQQEFLSPVVTPKPHLSTVSYSTPKTVSIQQQEYITPVVSSKPHLPTVSFSTPKTEFIQQNQYLSPVVTSKPHLSTVSYGTPKTVSIQQQEYLSPVVTSKPQLSTISYSTPKTEFIQQNQYLPPVVTSKPQLSTISYSAPKTVSIQQQEYFSVGVTSKPHLSAVSYSTPKTVSIEQPVYTGESLVPALPEFEASKIPVGAEIPGTVTPLPTVAKTPVQSVFVSRQQELVTPKVNLLLPTSTAIPDFVTPQTNDLFIHDSYQKINEHVRPAVQNVFPDVSDKSRFFQFRPQNQTTGIPGAVLSEVKYAINPNIAIPEPPKEYILQQNSFTTAIPEITTARTAGGFKSSTYLPPPGRKSSKTTLISVGSLDEDDIRDDNVLFDKYSGRFGQVIGSRNGKVVTQAVRGNGRGEIEVNGRGSSTVRYEVSSSTQRPVSRGRKYHGGITSGIQATNKYEEYEIDGQRSLDEDSKTTLDLKNLKLEKNKKTVIVVSQVSDANPILVGKLAGQCSCQSNMLEIRSKGKKSDGGRRKNKPVITNQYLPPFETNEAAAGSTPPPETVIIDGSRVTSTTAGNYVSSTTSSILSSLGPDGVLSITPKPDDKIKFRKKQFRGRARYLPPSSSPEDGAYVPLASAVPAAEIASTFDYSVLRGDESRSQNEIELGGGGSGKAGAGAAFDRYGPGGWRGFDEVLQGSVDCKRPGLFRHPKYCNKFYACNYDPWKERYTLHVFNCPIHLTYDSSISACNWPVRGPACADDNLLV